MELRMETAKHGPQVSVRVGHELADEIERAAEEERRTRSSLVRNLLEDWAAARRAGDGQDDGAGS
jgi:Arc/MetJ-type ribon-helix-helix transcriptional regulator